MNHEVLIKMRFNPTGHNAIYTDHLETITDVLMSECPINRTEAIPIIGASVGLSDKFVKEHMRRLEACKVIRTKGGVIYWLLSGAKNNNVIPSDKSNEITEGSINEQSNIVLDDNKSTDTLKPCKHRNDKLMTCSVNSRITQIKDDRCNHCGSRSEDGK